MQDVQDALQAQIRNESTYKNVYKNVESTCTLGSPFQRETLDDRVLTSVATLGADTSTLTINQNLNGQTSTDTITVTGSGFTEVLGINDVTAVRSYDRVQVPDRSLRETIRAADVVGDRAGAVVFRRRDVLASAALHFTVRGRGGGDQLPGQELTVPVSIGASSTSRTAKSCLGLARTRQ